MYESQQALIAEIKTIKNLRQQFDTLWKLRIKLSQISDFGVHASLVDVLQQDILSVDQALLENHAMPFYEMGGNPAEGYADRLIGKEEEIHIVCNKTDVSSAVTNSQLGAFCVLVQNMINQIHWDDYHGHDLDKINKIWIDTISDSELV